MLRTLFIASLMVSACAPTATTPVYVGTTGPQTGARPRGKAHGVALRGRVPRGKRVDYIVAVQVDPRGRRQRIRVKPAADGSYALRLPPGHRYAMAYEERGRVVGNVSFPGANGRPSQSINVTQNVTVNQQYIDLGEPTYVGGVYVAAVDPYIYLDSDADGIVDAQDTDYVDEGWVASAEVFEGDFEEVDETGWSDDADIYDGTQPDYSAPAGGDDGDDGGDDGGEE